MATTEKNKVRQKRKQLLIIDDQPVYREGFQTRLERDSRFIIAGDAGSGRQGIRLAKSIKPDLVVMEVLLPDQDAFHVIRILRRLFPKTPVIILSAYRQTPFITEALRSGARGYLLKESHCERIIEGLETVLRGEYYLDHSLSRDLFLDINSHVGDNGRRAKASNKNLTPREQEIMGLLAEGESRKQIAQRLAISRRTVENHAASIMRKLSLKNTIQLVRYAAKLGLINVDEWKGEPLGMQEYGPSFVRQI